MRKPNWDTDAGRRMWMSGKKDAEIADAFGVSVHAVTCYRVKHWQQTMTPKRGKIKEEKAPVAAGAGVDPAVLDKIRDNAKKAGIQLPGFKQEISTPPVAAHNDVAGAAAPDSPLAGLKAFDFERGLKPPIGEPEVVPAPAEKEERVATPVCAPARNDSDKDTSYTVPRPRLDEMDIMAAATEHLSGMKAVCTACAIQALWYWTGPADLRRAKKNIDWLLDHIEG